MTIKNKKIVKAPDSHENCVMCGINNRLSLNLSFESDEQGKVFTILDIPTEFQGFSGKMHGGIISALLDSAMTHCLFDKKIEAVTAELKVRFLKPIHCNSRLHISAWIIEKYFSLYKLKSEITIDGKVFAKAESKFMRLKELS